jgi:hypothetical protein
VSLPPCPVRSIRSDATRVDAPEDLPKESRSQRALGQPEDEVPGMPDQVTTGRKIGIDSIRART